METRQRSDRWSDEPILNEDGEPIVVEIQDSDRELFKILAPGSHSRDPWSYKFLPRDYLLAVAKRGRLGGTERIKILLRKPDTHLRLPDQPETITRHQIIALDKNGADELRELRINVPHIRPGRLVHDLMECIIAASFEIGTHEVPDVSITPMAEIIASSPARTQKMKNPKYLPSIFEGEPVDVLPDWEPFAINTPRGGVFLPGFEADTGTETLWSRTLQHGTSGGNLRSTSTSKRTACLRTTTEPAPARYCSAR